MVRRMNVEEILLGEPLEYTIDEVAKSSGITEAYGMRIWAALGFPTPPLDAIAFTEEDIKAMIEIRELLGHEYVDEEMVVELARGVGQTMGRLASWLGEVWLQRLAEHLVEPGQPVTEEIVGQALAASAELRPRFEQLLLRGWRRQLSAAGMRVLTSTAAATADPAAGTALLAVGFADIVSFTRLSRSLAGPELATLVGGFETITASIIAELGGRVIKTLGDEVLFTAPDAATGAEIALRIAERSGAEFPKVRVGMAFGEVILRLGDVFGTPVNLAARLTSIAYPGTVVIDSGLTHALDASFERVSLRARPLQGLGRVYPWLLRRPAKAAKGAS